MADDGAPQLDPTKVRIGLAMVTVVVLVCVVLALTADAVVVKALISRSRSLRSSGRSC